MNKFRKRALGRMLRRVFDGSRFVPGTFPRRALASTAAQRVSLEYTNPESTGADHYRREAAMIPTSDVVAVWLADRLEVVR